MSVIYGIINRKSSGGGSTPTEYTHTQNSANTTWNVVHNLGFKPDVAIYTTGGVEVIAEVLHVSNNILTITLASPITGYARCT